MRRRAVVEPNGATDAAPSRYFVPSNALTSALMPGLRWRRSAWRRSSTSAAAASAAVRRRSPVRRASSSAVSSRFDSVIDSKVYPESGQVAAGCAQKGKINVSKLRRDPIGPSDRARIDLRALGAQHTTSRADGSYRLAGVRSGPAVVTVSSDDVPPQHVNVTVGKTTTRLDLRVCSTTLDYNCGIPQ
jgi:hypothetical protein